MLNETRKAHIKRMILRDSALKPIGEVVIFEIARREHTLIGLERQEQKEREEIGFLKMLNLEELAREAEKNSG